MRSDGSYFELGDVGVGLPGLILVHLPEEVGALVVLEVGGVEVVLGGLDHGLGLELGHAAVFDLLVDFLAGGLLLALPGDAFVLHPLQLLVFLLLRLEFGVDVSRLFLVTLPGGSGDPLLDDGCLGLEPGGGAGREVEVGEGVEVVVELLEGIEDVGSEAIVLVFAEPEEVLEVALVELGEALLALLPAHCLQRPKLLAQCLSWLVSDAVVVELVQDPLLDHLLHLFVVLGSHLLPQPDPGLELQVVLQETVHWPLAGFDFSLKHPVLLGDDLGLQLFDLLLEVVLLFVFRLLLLVLELDLSEVVELVVDEVVSLVFALLLLAFLSLFGEVALLLLELFVLLRVALVLVGLHLFLVDLFSVQAHVVLPRIHFFVVQEVVFLFALLLLVNHSVRSFLLLLALLLVLLLALLLSFQFFLHFLLILVLLLGFSLFLCLLAFVVAGILDILQECVSVVVSVLEEVANAPVDLCEDLLVVHAVGGEARVRGDEMRECGDEVEELSLAVQLLLNELVDHC